jgi:hypothetical protein
MRLPAPAIIGRGVWGDLEGAIMPPRIPAVLLFVVVYFAVVIGGGFDAPALRVDLWSPAIASALGAGTDAFGIGTRWPVLGARILEGWLYLRVDEALAFLAAALALPDAAWRPARSFHDRWISVGTAALTLAMLTIEPRFLTPAFGVLAALAVGDALAALGNRSIRLRMAG